MKISVQIAPNARKNECISFQDSVLKIKIRAPAVEGKANRELIDFLAQSLGVRKNQITIDSGEHARQKRLEIDIDEIKWKEWIDENFTDKR